MGIVLRQSLKGSIAQYLGVLIGYINLLYILPYCLTPEQNGLFRLLLETATFFALFAQSGIPNAIPRFGPEFKSIGQEKKLIRFALASPILTISLFGLVYVLFFREEFNNQLAASSPMFLQFELWLIPLVIAIVYQNVLEYLIANYFRITVSKIIREVLLRIGLGLICWITFYFGLGLSAFLSLFASIYIIGALAMLSYFVSLKSKQQNQISSPNENAPWKKLIVFMSLILVSGLGTNLVNKLDIFMVSSQIGLTDNAIYSTAFLITMVIEVPSRSFQQIMAPIISESIHSNNHRKISWAYKKSSSGQSLAAIIILCLLLINARWIYSSMPDSSVYAAGFTLIVFLGLAKVFDAFTGINGLILANSKYYYVGIYFTIALAVLAIFLNNLLIPEFGLNGVAYATAISIALYNLIMSLFVWYRFRITPFSSSSIHLLSFIVLSGSFLFIQSALHFEGFWSSIIATLLYIIGVILLLLKFPILKEIRLIMKKFSLIK